MVSHRSSRLDGGATRVEVALAFVIVIVLGSVAIVVVGNAGFGWVTSAPAALEELDGQAPSTAASAAEPVAVNVAAAATISEPDDDGDACASLLGKQPRGFDCSLPLYVDAMDKSRPAGKVKYFCKDSTRYHVVGGQRPARHKMCVLTTAARAGY